MQVLNWKAIEPHANCNKTLTVIRLFFLIYNKAT